MQSDKYSLKAFDEAIDAVKAECEHLLTDDGTSIMYIDRERWRCLSKLDIYAMRIEKDVTPHVSAVIFKCDVGMFKWYIPTCCIRRTRR